MQPIHTGSSVGPGDIEKIKLPLLRADDIDKLDYLLFCMKQKQAEFVNIHSVCKEKWGDNRLLYLFFAEYLKKNHFTMVQGQTSNPEYAWQQMIAPRGLVFDSFKNEYLRQQEEKRKQTPGMTWYKFVTSYLIHYFLPLCMATIKRMY